jgi:predicted acyl esterase
LQETSTWIDPDLRYRMISEAAYALYAARGYQDGYDTDDWLAAEARVDRDLQSGTAPA